MLGFTCRRSASAVSGPGIQVSSPEVRSFRLLQDSVLGDFPHTVGSPWLTSLSSTGSQPLYFQELRQRKLAARKQEQIPSGHKDTEHVAVNSLWHIQSPWGWRNGKNMSLCPWVSSQRRQIKNQAIKKQMNSQEGLSLVRFQVQPYYAIHMKPIPDWQWRNTKCMVVRLFFFPFLFKISL